MFSYNNSYLFVFICWLFISITPMQANANSASIDKNNNTTPDTNKAIPVTKDTFICLKKMHSVRGFFVDNILGNADDTISAANQSKGAPYPAGSIVQLIPTEVMIKQSRDKHYTFRDNTGTIEVEIDNEDFRGAKVTPETKVRIVGEVDKDWNSTTVDTDYLEVVI
jgi:uncharacterized protein (TIGR00156 family)